MRLRMETSRRARLETGLRVRVANAGANCHTALPILLSLWQFMDDVWLPSRQEHVMRGAWMRKMPMRQDLHGSGLDAEDGDGVKQMDASGDSYVPRVSWGISPVHS